MNLNEIESHVEIATLIEELERTFVEAEERRAKERIERGEVVFVRPAKIREVVYEYFSLHNHFEARGFTKKLSTNTRKLDFYVNSIVSRVCEFFKSYNYYRKPLPKELIERVVDYYVNVVIANRRVYVITKNSSKRKHKVRAPQGSKFVQTKLRGSSPKAATQGREKALGAKALNEGAR
jgi:hypothetical protein